MTRKEEILRVKGEIKKTYSKLSKIYAILEGIFEKRLRARGLEYLAIQKGETILEIGFATGCTCMNGYIGNFPNMPLADPFMWKIH